MTVIKIESKGVLIMYLQYLNRTQQGKEYILKSNSTKSCLTSTDGEVFTMACLRRMFHKMIFISLNEYGHMHNTIHRLRQSTDKTAWDRKNSKTSQKIKP